MTNLDDPWRIVRERAGIENVWIHDCRRSFASRALAPGESLPVIAKLLGHSQIRTTARYAHLARDSVKASAAHLAGRRQHRGGFSDGRFGNGEAARATV